MTKARFVMQGNAFSADIIGHSNHADGAVCTGCSMLACTLIESMRRAEADGYLVVFECDASAGDVKLQVVAADYGRKSVRAVFDTIISGYELLAAQYPDNVRLEVM